MNVTTKRGAGLLIAGVLGLLLAMIAGLIVEDQRSRNGLVQAVDLASAALFLGGLIAVLVGLGVIAWSLLRQPQRD